MSQDHGAMSGQEFTKMPVPQATPQPPRGVAVDQDGEDQNAPTQAQTPLSDLMDAQNPAPAAPAATTEAKPRPISADDFMAERRGRVEPGPATIGWRGRLNRMLGTKLRMGTEERSRFDDRAMIQRSFSGPKTVVFINPKGGAGKTTSVALAGMTFGQVRGGGVVAWDNNETRGSLGNRAHLASHNRTTFDLLEDVEKFSDVYGARIGDLSAFMRTQGDAMFDVLASDDRAEVTGEIDVDGFTKVHELLERFYKVILVDTGNNIRAGNWLAASAAADLIVVTSTVREDTAQAGLWTLDTLANQIGHEELAAKTVTVLSDPAPKPDQGLLEEMERAYSSRTRQVCRVPYDPALVPGSIIPYDQLSSTTRRAWLRACAAMAEAL